MPITIPHVVDSAFGWLNTHRFNRYSQYGEDGLLKAILSVIGESNRWAFECGAGDGVTFSNTLWLVEQGWRGLFVECNKRDFVEMCRRHESPGGKRMGLPERAIRVHAELTPSGPVWAESLLEKVGAPMDVDVFSLDIEGGEEDILQGFQRLRPRVLCVEHTAVVYSHLAEMLATLETMGYIPVVQTETNLIAVLPDLAELLKRSVL